jgi:hypothetical protein
VHKLYWLIVILLFSGSTYAEGFYIGGGLSSIKLSSGHPSINEQSGGGYHVLAGTRSKDWAIELAATGGLSFSTGETQGIYYPEDSAEYGNLDLGLKRLFHPEAYPGLTPWLGAGLGLHFITWDTYYYDVGGLGYSLTGGVDYYMTMDWLVRGGVVYHDFTTDDTYDYGPYDDSAMQLNITIMYLF